ncbi:tRNA N6-adenosine threonylcarbamoyltransferase, mitochondrial [Dendroctonus ponderosae]|uniref:N(6)-L-threonylcarbamoyladenine synthase n=1 Tax=Dendroctonus ponderosae TaxID=77166 RepID=A0AAR5PUY1_DENPD|nr:tRNA N6-adenosine threonylcarbamoyltransferase, mitochondrial [Dendroctonus ponderosae]KAH1001582.1 hypothetical protein HUJ04_005580 [Dendroctonus ponderosae]KAH1004560.1 hypothetical protein HUJ05_005356 [Dendroctonus ponderosae]
MALLYQNSPLKWLNRYKTGLKGFRRYSKRRSVILGIESSCDDTGCGIIDTEGNILGESLHSQLLVHLNNGGIIPPVAGVLHRKNIEQVVESALKSANLSMKDIDAVAATVKPGLPMSLEVGTMFGKLLCRKHQKPFIPIHHMEAHALTARLQNPSLEFPFLVLLISGGHCLLAVAHSVDKFALLGESIDDAPGEAFDKMARRMKLRNLPEYYELSGGQAIELAASKADDPLQFPFTPPLLQYKDCKFSFAGAKNVCKYYIEKEELSKGVAPDEVIPDVANLSAAFLLVVTKHLCQRLQRAMEYVARKSLIPIERQTLVVSGGVACNNFIAQGLEIVCNEYNYKLVRPPAKLCTDNGIMVAWNAVERWKANIGVYKDFEGIEVEKISPLGASLIEDVSRENISCKWVKLAKLLDKDNQKGISQNQ